MGNKEKTSFGYREIDKDEKETLVKEVFDTVAEKYDLMNDLMSMGTHRLWKRFVVSKSSLSVGDYALDVAGGTGDLSLLMAKKVTEKGQVVVFDINREMLKAGRKKRINEGNIKNIRWMQGNAEAIPFEDNTFKCTTIGFGIRNVTNRDKAFAEMIRVTDIGGKVMCLEFSHPTNGKFKALYNMYSEVLLPNIGGLITGSRESYEYLHESIRKFPDQETLKKELVDLGLSNVKYYNLFNGIAALHIGIKA